MTIRNSKGFTLLEILIVLIILGVIAGIAIPSFQTSVERSRANEAQTNLRLLKEAQTRFFARNGAFAAANLAAGCNNGAQLLDFNPYCDQNNATLAVGAGGLNFAYTSGVANSVATRGGAGPCAGNTITLANNATLPVGTGCYQ